MFAKYMEKPHSELPVKKVPFRCPYTHLKVDRTRWISPDCQWSWVNFWLKGCGSTQDIIDGPDCTIDTIQDFLCKLGMKPHMHLLEISILSLKKCHHQTHQNYEQSRQKLGTFLENKVLKKSKFSFIKVDVLVKYSLQKKNSERFGWFLMPKNDFESTNFANNEKVCS